MLKYLIPLVLFLTPSISLAEETRFDVMLGDGAMICDKPESVVEGLTMNVRPADCGVFRSRTGAPVTVTVIGELGDKPLVQFFFHVPPPWGNQTQYGWWAGELPAEEKPGVEL